MGSIIGLLNIDGTYAEKYSYDAWGRMRNSSTWAYYAPGSEPALFIAGRGFTGHEHLPWFNLINMNGRVYDALIGSFLSPDNYVQDPGATHSFNRYTYCLNNPLKYTDPTGMLACPELPYSGNPAGEAWLANYYSQSFGGGGGGGVNTVTGFWDRNASTAGMLGFRYENGQYIDNATSNIVPFNVVYNNYITPHSSESYSFEGNNIEWGYYAQVKGGPMVALTFVLSDGTRLKFDFGNELNGSIYKPPSSDPGRYFAADMTEQICAGALNFSLGLFLGGVAEIGFLGSSVATQTGSAVETAANSAKSWLGRGADWIINKSGDVIFTSEDGLRRFRYNTINPHGDLPHVHLEEFIRDKWRDAIPGIHRIYPKP
jgi:RHS repeat-associated protein